ncbi:hypothetical protein JYU34_021724 [Plutella xylostella]|uniref:Uncharacterized protein n=1 Tax=Plutella xylostella TaxID=51655 RepID=A0ABQ7PSX1_PLUXY|nr:hypothetical protein JYU34_021724 [Plutella xylostella]
MDQQNMTSVPLMPKEEEKVVVLTPSHGGVGKILVREDTVLANLQGCAGCGRAQFNCGGVQKQWSALCWGKNSGRSNYCLITLLSTIFTLSCVGTILLCCTNVIHDVVVANMVLKNGSMAFKMWQRPAVLPLMKVHVFNYSNWDRVRQGLDTKLEVHDVGPYVYEQQVERVNIAFQNDSLTFQERNRFTFLPERSTGAILDKVSVPNLPYLGVVSLAIDNLNVFTKSMLNAGLQMSNHPNAFIHLPVHRFLWGYEDSVISAARPLLSILGQLPFEQFGLLVTKNGTVPERLTINTGEYDVDKMNIIERLDGKPSLSYWSNRECNSIEGSDGSMFPPSLLDRRRQLNVFFPKLCRRVPFQYEKDVESEDGIQLLRYRMPADVFDSPQTNRNNQCFCNIDTGVCPPKGVINVTACSMGVPALVSFPHFYLGDPALRDEFTGLQPDPAKHDSFLDIHPKLGISLSGKSSLQLNIQVRKDDTGMFTAVKWLKKDLILPVAWLEMSVEELPESVRSLVYHGTYSTAAVQLGLTATCIVTLILSTLGLIVLYARSKKPKPCATIKKLPIETELKVQNS